jgi:superfamily II DNA or RNA helicase
MARGLKRFQQAAVDNALRIFMHVKGLLDVAPDPLSRADAVAHNGFLLLEAPTGSGKTMMAGKIAEQFAFQEDVVWFWFAPFKGVVGQTAGFLREEFAGLRLRDLQNDRDIGSSRRGDVFVTTWQTVATRVTDRRNVRKTGELAPSVDELAAGLRDMGLRIGVVVDEAHHGFHGETLAAQFFRDVLRPEYAVLITATPDDKDLEDFEKRIGVAELKRTSISRYDVVESGLIKRGVKCIAYLAEEDKQALVDFEQTALRDGTACHRRIKQLIQEAGHSLTPLMLVQVDKSKGSVERAVETLQHLGFKKSEIAVHTADEPDANILALANDETKEVLVFKMAVALGFDAPRAFTLVSMRASRDPDFGVQLVGRILRVHRRLQNRDLPDFLNYGYVFLADAEAQQGIDAAGQRINQIRTEYAKVSTATALVQTAGGATVQVLGPGGQTYLFRTQDAQPTSPGAEPESFVLQALFPKGAIPPVSPDSADSTPGVPPAEAAARVVWGKHVYALKPGVPRRFLSQDVKAAPEVTEAECAAQFVVSARDLLSALAGRVKVQKRTLDVFTQQLTLELVGASIDPGQATRIAQRVLRKSGYFHPKELETALLERLQTILAEEALDGADDPARVEQFLDIILATHPQLLYEAQRKALVKYATTVPTEEPLPEERVSDTPLPSSWLNVYGIMPPDLNSWERAFAEWLDGDTSGVVQWWHRNPVDEEWSVCVMLADGRAFYPDFVIGLKGRKTQDGVLLADTKYGFEVGQEFPKLLAEHPDYGRAMIITRSADRWHVATVDSDGRPKMGGELRLSDLAGF